MPTAPIDGVDLYYEVHGEGLPVVLCHGIGGNHASWFQQVGPFAERYRVVVFDHRAFGRSAFDPSANARSRFVDDFEALLDHLGIQRTAIVAQSMGGGTAAGFTVRCPQRVSALVLADTLVGMDEPPEVREAMVSIRKATADLSPARACPLGRVPRAQPNRGQPLRRHRQLQRGQPRQPQGRLRPPRQSRGPRGDGSPSPLSGGPRGSALPT